MPVSSPLQTYFVNLLNSCSPECIHDTVNILLVRDNAKARPSVRRQTSRKAQMKACRWSSGTLLCDMDSEPLVNHTRKGITTGTRGCGRSESSREDAASRPASTMDYRWGSCGNHSELYETRGAYSSGFPRVPSRSSASSQRRESSTSSEQNLSSFRKSLSLPSLFVELPYEVSESTKPIDYEGTYEVGLCIDDDDCAEY
jgi:hypothetical protein